MVRRESRPNTISHITLGTKQTGAPSAGNLHAGCDVAGAGNGFTVWLLRHSQRKRGATARLDLRNTAPVLDPTGIAPQFQDQMGAKCIAPWEFPVPTEMGVPPALPGRHAKFDRYGSPSKKLLA